MERMCGWKDGTHIVLELAEKLGRHSQVPWLMRKEFPRDAEGSAIHKIRGRATRVLPPGCPDAEEYKWELIHPAWALEVSLEGSLQLSPRDCWLGAVSRHVGGRDPEQLVEFGRHVTGELRAPIGGDIIRHSEAGDPVTDEGSRTVLSGGSGMASGHRVKRSMTVKRYFMPSDSSRRLYCEEHDQKLAVESAVLLSALERFLEKKATGASRSCSS